MLNRTHYYHSFIKHYLSATLIDVLHSPFVFNLYNHCIKKKSIQQLPENIDFSSLSYFDQRAEDVLLKYVLYYKPSKIYLAGKTAQGDFADMLHTLNIPFDKTLPFHKSDLIYFDHVPDTAKIEGSMDHIDNDSVMVVRKMYDSKAHTARWNEVKKLPEITVTIDLFFVGLIFFRKEQAKQDFKLRMF